MSRQKDFRIFCQNNELYSNNESPAWESFRRAELGLPWGEEKGGECPECGGGSVKNNGNRWFCFYCHKSGLLPDGMEMTPEQIAAERQLIKEKQAENQERALKIWNNACVRITGSNAQVHTYLGTRGLSLEPLPDLDGVMRWHPKCPYGRDKLPCVVSLFKDAKTDLPTAIHRTHIVSASGGEAERMALGPYFGSVIKLWPLKKGETTLTIGEGIESVLSAVRLGFGETPAWAATVAGNLSRIPVIRGVRRLTITADNDAHGKGQEHALILHERWQGQGREVETTTPDEAGKDFNDVLVELLRGRS